MKRFSLTVIVTIGIIYGSGLFWLLWHY